MFGNPIILQIAIFVGVSGTLFALAMLFKGNDRQLEARLDGLNDAGRSILRLGRGSVRKNTTLKGTLKAALQRMGGKLLPKQGDERRTDLQMRLLHAGLYAPSAASIPSAYGSPHGTAPSAAPQAHPPRLRRHRRRPWEG